MTVGYLWDFLKTRAGAFGVGAAGGQSGGSLMERNLTLWTVVFAVLFAINTIVLIKIG